MSEWKEYKLGELIQSISETYKFKPREKVVFLNTSDILDGKFLTDNLSEASTLPGQAKKKIQKGDILYSEIRPANKRFALVDFDCDNYVVSTKLMVLRCNDNVDNRFIYNYLTSKEVLEYLQMVAEDRSGTFPQITFDIIANMDIELPTIEEQRRIASILTSLDDKIDLLRRENATLEAMAETLFRQWFVVEAKEEWEEVLITDLFEVKDGTHDSPKPQEYGHKLITSKYIHNNSIDLSGAYNISDNDFTNINKRSKVDTNDILFSMIGTIGLIYLEQNAKVDYAIKNVGLLKTSQNSNWKYFVYLWFKSELGLEWIHENKTGSTQEYISLNSLRNIKFRIKSLKQVQEFDQIINVYFEKLRTNKQQIQTLIQTRDGLLPRLMGGEIDYFYE